MAKIKKLPFLFTPPIVRYVERIISEYEKRNQGILNQEILPFSIRFETYTTDEPFLSHYEDMRKSFIDYLEQRGAIKFHFISGGDSRFFDEKIYAEDDIEANEKSMGYFEKSFEIEVLEITPIKDIWVYHTKHPNPSLLKGTMAFDDYSVNFDGKRLVHHKKFHNFQNGLPKKVFVELWERRSHTNAGAPIHKPEILSRKELAEITGRKEDAVKQAVHNIYNTLLSKGFPIRVKNTKDGVLMTIKEV